ncbi:MAG: hypothetical protein PHP32_03480 [Candidatus Izemoplasmatales bacterium]|nr:hypothetical protein [Candidatus Izemoplasmatales bacterium]
MKTFEQIKRQFGLVHDRQSFYRKANTAERQAAQSTKTADELRTMGRTLILAGVIGIIAQAFSSNENNQIMTNAMVIALLGFVTWLLGMILTGRYIQNVKQSADNQNHRTTGDKSITQTANSGRNGRG